MAAVALMKTVAEQQLAAEWQEAAPRLPGLAGLRAAAFERFAAAGLPSRRVEEWKYTDLRALMRDAKPLVPPPDAAAKMQAKQAGAALTSIEPRRIMFVNGAFVPELSDLGCLEGGLSIGSMAEALDAGDSQITQEVGRFAPKGDIPVALNTAFMSDGALIRIAEAEASCELWGLLKRPDEKFVTERAYENPKFVEDLVRDVAVRLNADARVIAYTLEAENFESIHNHSAYAVIEHDKRAA